VSALRALLAEVEDSTAASDSASTSASCEPPAKRSKLEIEQAASSDFFADLFSSSAETAEVNEVDDYLASTDSTSDVLSFCAAKQKQWCYASPLREWL